MNLTAYVTLISLISSVGVFIAAYVLHGIGLSKMLRSCGFRKPYFAFLPFFRVFAAGTLSEVFDDRREAKKRGSILLFLAFAYVLTYGVYLASSFMAYYEPIVDFWNAVQALPENATEDAVSTVINNFVTAVELSQNTLMSVFSLISSVCSLIYSVYTCTVFFRIFGIFAPRHAFVFAIISILSPLALAVLLFALRNRRPQNLRWQRNDTYSEY